MTNNHETVRQMRKTMKWTQKHTQPTHQPGRPEESGVALITVLALLSIFAVVLVGFTYSIRVEENTIESYSQSVNVAEGTEAAIQGVLGQIARDLSPESVNIVLGRPGPR